MKTCSWILQSEEEAASVARVLEFYISNFGVLGRRVYWTPSGAQIKARTTIHCGVMRHAVMQSIGCVPVEFERGTLLVIFLARARLP